MPVVRVTMQVWDAMGRDLEVLKEEKRAAEIKIAKLEEAKQTATHQVADYKDDLHTQIGKLQYQNESNKVQKATMARTLSEKDIEIKQLQLELASTKKRAETAADAARDYARVVEERHYLQDTLKNDRSDNLRQLADLTNVKNREIATLSNKIEELQEAFSRATAAANAHAHSDEHEVLAQNRLNQLNQREKLLNSTKEKYAAEHAKVGELEDCIEDLQRKLSQVGDLQRQLQEKSRDCDRFRTKLKNQEKIVEDYKQRILRASSDGKALRGAAHLVVPKPDTKFSHLVLGCSECYTKNITCDDKARCRHCTENNEKCARWRCSLKHILGQCPDIPCCYPHESDGWLLATDPRPEW
jgi:chromosome segregation ATPase